MTPFTLIVPTKLTDATFISSSVLENDYPVWDAGTTYSIGTRVIVTAGHHKIYESIASGHTGVFPPTDGSKWVEVGPTNRWAMFDESGGTITQAANTIEVVFTGAKVTGIGLLELAAKTVRIQGKFGGDTFYDETYQLPDRATVTDWYEYFQVDPDPATEAVFLNIPFIAGAEFTVTISNPGGTVRCGNIIFGAATYIGKVQYGATSGIIDYSRKVVDEFGRVTLVQRNFSKKINVNVYVESNSVDRVQSQLSKVRAVPCLWIGSANTYESLTVYGFYRDFSFNISYPTYSVLSLEVEGLT